jgi:hypothetical protein
MRAFARRSRVERSERRPTRRRVSASALALIVALVVLGTAGTAVAFWTAGANGDAAASAGSIGAGQKPTFTISGRDVIVSWAAATNATSYTVVRANVSPQSLSTTEHGTCASNVAALTCSDTDLPENGTAATNWTYSDTGARNLWTGTSSTASNTVTIPGPTVGLGTSSFTTAGGSSTATVSNFFDSEGVTYCVDASSACPGGSTLGTDTVPASGGTKTTSSITIPAGLALGSHTVYAIGNAGSVPSTTITVGVGAASKLVITSSGFSTTAATSATNPFTTMLEDAFGNPTTSGSPVTVNLASSSTGKKFAATSGGGSVTSVTLPANTQSVTAFYADTVAGTPTLTVSATGLSDGTQTETITAGSAAKLAITSTSFTATAGTSAANPFTTTLEDAFGNPTTSGSPVTVNLASSSTGKKFAATSGGGSVTSVTLPANTQSVTAFYADTVAGTPTLTVSGSGLTPNGTQTETVVGAGASVMTLSNCTVNTASVTCGTAFALGNGGTLTAKVTVTDAFGNVPANTTVSMTVTSGSPANYTVSGSPATITNGSVSSTFTVQKNGNANNNTTIVVHATSGSYADLSFTVQK